LIDKVERNLSKINRKDIITNLFGGEISNLIVGSKCDHTSERIEPFLSIRLEIKDKKTLQEAFNEFIKGEVLEGDNAYLCERCDSKIKAVKRVCLKTLPEVLIITLKRFEFDFETMEKFKLNTYCEFPELLNVMPYTR
jgi:ubiquitin carboxyl-terminal hydrolase 9/24